MQVLSGFVLYVFSLKVVISVMKHIFGIFDVISKVIKFI